VHEECTNIGNDLLIVNKSFVLLNNLDQPGNLTWMAMKGVACDKERGMR
jgi:hypothetical protein